MVYVEIVKNDIIHISQWHKLKNSAFPQQESDSYFYISTYMHAYDQMEISDDIKRSMYIVKRPRDKNKENIISCTCR